MQNRRVGRWRPARPNTTHDAKRALDAGVRWVGPMYTIWARRPSDGSAGPISAATPTASEPSRFDRAPLTSHVSRSIPPRSKGAAANTHTDKAFESTTTGFLRYLTHAWKKITP